MESKENNEINEIQEKAFACFIDDFRKTLRKGILEIVEAYVESSPNKIIARELADFYIAKLPPIDKSVDFDYLEKNHLLRQMRKSIIATRNDGTLNKNNIMETPKLIIGHDNTCPVTKLQCEDECCAPGSECNLSGSNIEPLTGFQSKCPITSKNNGQG